MILPASGGPESTSAPIALRPLSLQLRDETGRQANFQGHCGLDTTMSEGPLNHSELSDDSQFLTSSVALDFQHCDRERREARSAIRPHGMFMRPKMLILLRRVPEQETF